MRGTGAPGQRREGPVERYSDDGKECQSSGKQRSGWGLGIGVEMGGVRVWHRLRHLGVHFGHGNHPVAMATTRRRPVPRGSGTSTKRALRERIQIFIIQPALTAASIPQVMPGWQRDSSGRVGAAAIRSKEPRTRQLIKDTGVIDTKSVL